MGSGVAVSVVGLGFPAGPTVAVLQGEDDVEAQIVPDLDDSVWRVDGQGDGWVRTHTLAPWLCT